MKVRCRMAPSPTGLLHIGTAHTTLFNFLYAKHHKGDFVLRIDDSDPVRSTKESEEDIVSGLKWLGIVWDEGPDVGGPFAPYRQSERKDTYKKYIDQLLKTQKAYRCFCSKEEVDTKRKQAESEGKIYIYDQKCKNLSQDEIKILLDEGKTFVVRLINANKKVTFTDMVRGEITVDTTNAGDFIITRSDGSPLLNIAVVIDDIEFQITHVIRGEDFLNATPYQILIYEALGIAPPKIANLSFIYAPDHSKLSKRHGATGISEYRQMGYLPEAMVNFLAFLGWNPGDEREIFTIEELISEFDFDKVQRGSPTFNKVKFDWFNQQYIKILDDVTLSKRLTEFTTRSESDIVKVLPLIKDRLVTLKDFDLLTSYFFDTPKIIPEMFKKYSNTKNVLEHVILTLDKSWDGKVLEEKARAFCSENNVKVGDYFMILRIAVTGSPSTPPIWEVMEVLGKTETFERLQAASNLKFF